MEVHYDQEMALVRLRFKFVSAIVSNLKDQKWLGVLRRGSQVRVVSYRLNVGKARKVQASLLL